MDIFIDIGSTRIKWCKGGGDIFSLPFPSESVSKPPYFEVNPQKIWDIILGIVQDSKIKRIFMSVQMHGYVLLGESNREVSNYISWRDRRAGLVKMPFPIAKENGVDLKDNLPRASLYAMRVLAPEDYNRAQEFCTLGSYLTYKLTGYNATHITDAAASGFYNTKTCEGTSDGLKLPVAFKDIELVGFSPNNAAVYTPVGDQQAAVLGSGAGEGDYVMNLGTAGQLCCIKNGFTAGDFESRPYFGDKTLCTVTNLMAGSAINHNEAKDWTERFFNDYNNAFKKLPKSNKIIVTGGVVRYTKNKLIQILDRLGLPYEFNKGEAAIDGLKKIADSITQTIPQNIGDLKWNENQG